MDFFTPENLTNLGANLAIIITAVATVIKVFQKKLNDLAEDNVGKLRGNIKLQSEFDTKIMKKLEDVREQLNADRVQVYDFHNGIHYANGRSAIRISCTYESVRYSIKSFQNSLNGIPISCLPNFISSLLSNGEFICKDIESIKEQYPATYSFKKNMDIKSFYDIVFHNSDGDVVGFIAIQFCNNKYNIDSETIQKLVWFVETELISLMNSIGKR